MWNQSRNADLEREIFLGQEGFVINSLAAVLSQWWKSALPQLNMRDSWIEAISLSIPCLFMHMQCGMVVDLHHHTEISYRFLPQQWSWAPVKCWCLRLEPGFSPCRIFIREPVIFNLWPLGKKETVLLPPRQILLQVEWLKPVLLGVRDRSLFSLHQLLVICPAIVPFVYGIGLHSLWAGLQGMLVFVSS